MFGTCLMFIVLVLYSSKQLYGDAWVHVLSTKAGATNAKGTPTPPVTRNHDSQDGAAGLSTLRTRVYFSNLRRRASPVLLALLCVAFHKACYYNSPIYQLTVEHPLDETSFLDPSAKGYYVQRDLLLGTKCDVDEPEVSVT